MARERAERNGNGNGNGAPNPEREAPSLSIAEIRQLITLMETSDLEEIIIEHGDELKLVLRNPVPGTAAGAGADAAPGEIALDGLDGAVAVEDESAARGKAHDTAIEIGSPLVGVYRARVKPGEKLLIRPGDVVREGQIVAAVEALNYVNEIESAAAGRVKAIFVRDGQPVEYGQPLLAIEPK